MTIGDDNFISTASAGASTTPRYGSSAASGIAARDFPSSDTNRQKVTSEFAAVLAGIVYRLRRPLLSVGLLPVPTAGVLLGFAIYLGGPLGVILGLFAAGPLVLGAWLVWQRQQMLAVIDPMESLATDVGRLIDLAGAWSYADESITALRGYSRNGWGPFRILRGVWTTLHFGSNVFHGAPNLPRRVLPFSPRRLQATASVAGFCLIGSFVAIFADMLIFTALAILP